jgi:DNA-binding NarL/FixJ family response regulator
MISILLELTKAKIVIYTGSNNPKLCYQSVFKGARGVINKAEPAETLLKAIEKIYEGELWLNRNATSRIVFQMAQANSPKGLSAEQKKLSTLTVKEEKVTRAIQLHSAKTLKQVAESLHISEHTLRNHLASIYNKLSVRNRMELYVFCGKYQKTDNPQHHPKRRSTDI